MLGSKHPCSLIFSFYCLCFLVLLPLTITAKTPGNVTLGSSLTAGKDNSSWLSPSGDFAFGFREIQPGSFLLSIWFDQIPEKTIVWSANRGQLAQSGSTIQLTTDGRFVLSDPTGQQMWSPGISGTGLTYGAMLDNGNFLLAANTSTIIWQSFDEPTDTMLPTQVMNQGLGLVSCYSETNCSSGRFSFIMQTDGNLEFYTLHFPQSSNNFAYWASNTVGAGYQVQYNHSGYLYLIANNGTILSQVLWDQSSADDFYQRIILEYDGVLRKYVYPKPSSSAVASWPMEWSVAKFMPENICSSVAEPTGSGVCGFNSICQIGGDQRPLCSCPFGYDWVDPNNELSGCQQQNFLAQKCDGGSEEAKNFYFVEMINTNWPWSDYEHFEGVTEDWCREICLLDCFCAVAIYSGDCWMKKFPLSSGIIDPGVGGKALIKIRNSTSTLQQPNGVLKKRDQTTLIITGSTLLGSSVLLNIFLLLAALRFVFRPNTKQSTTAEPFEVLPGTSARSFRYSQLEEATNNFGEKVGQGAFATVYKGTLDSETGIIVAVKKLDNVVKESDKEFQTEISAIARTNHRNLVQLVGFCNEGQHRLLVYEFMTNGSLAGFLFGDQRPSWYKRVQIALGTARGLCYLHEECSTQIIHCDIKPQNVLLDGSFTARICDFGLAKLLKTDQTRTTTAIRGTKGYVAPEWFRNLPITAKVDVYSYGILLLELVCCRKCFELETEDENQMILADWAYDCYKEGAIDLLLGNDEDALYDIKRVKQFVMIAIWCIQEDPSLRPSMKKVIQMLEGTIDVSVPPDPSSYISSIQ